MLSLFRKKPEPGKQDRDADRALRKVYEYGSISLALARVETYWSYNKSTPLESDRFVPFSHRDEPLRAHGVVDEYGMHDVRIAVDVEFVRVREKAAIGHCYLEQKAGVSTLKVVLNDPDGSVGEAISNAMRDGAISGSSYQHFGITVAKSDDLAAARTQIKELGYGPSLSISDIDCIRRVILSNAPGSSWRREFD